MRIAHASAVLQSHERDKKKVHDMTPPGSPSLKKPSSSALPAIGKSDDDYVWDVFYHRPASLSEWNAVAANIGTLYVLRPLFVSCRSELSSP